MIYRRHDEHQLTRHLTSDQQNNDKITKGKRNSFAALGPNESRRATRNSRGRNSRSLRFSFVARFAAAKQTIKSLITQTYIGQPLNDNAMFYRFGPRFFSTSVLRGGGHWTAHKSGVTRAKWIDRKTSRAETPPHTAIASAPPRTDPSRGQKRILFNIAQTHTFTLVKYSRRSAARSRIHVTRSHIWQNRSLQGYTK